MRDLVEKVVSGDRLTEPEARRLLDGMADPSTDPLLSSAALVGLRVRGETADELRGFALRLRELAIRPEIPADVQAVDVVGTGGDASGSLNLSTGAALVAAAAGVPVIKHGNRSVSSQSGSADVLEALGLDLPWEAARAGEVFARTGFTFLFAPSFHPAMKAIAPVRRALGIRTIFNLAGPLANPATPPFHVIGAYDLATARMMAATLAGMPLERAFVIHGEPGWDEPTPVGPYHLLDVTPGSISESVEDPADFGIPRCSAEDLEGGDAEHNALRLRRALEGEPGPHRDSILLGAALALRLFGEDAASGLARAADAIDSGAAARLLDRLTEKAHV
ncbi:MAG: anthranilate phosphoribosyltransferase [Acidimicrobiia bacterium]